MSAKYRQLADILRSELQELGRQGGGKLATEAELSQRYHMSRQTVRHALKLLEAEGLVKRRQGSGTYLSHTAAEDSRQIAVIATFLDDYIFPSILHDVQSGFAQAGYATLVFATGNQVGREREILLGLLDQRVSAILVEGSKTAIPTPNSDLYHTLQSRNIPILFFHGIYSNLSGFPCLMDDNYSGGYQLAQYLLEAGHRKIAGIFKGDDIQGPQRYHGVVSALRDAQLPIRDSGFFWYGTEGRVFLLEGGSKLLDEFIDSRLGDATAVVCYNDEIAYLLIKRLLETGREVPKDVAVVSFDNSFYSQIGPVTITSLGHGANRMGKAAAALLLDMLSGGKPRSLSLEWELFCRESG